MGGLLLLEKLILVTMTQFSLFVYNINGGAGRPLYDVGPTFNLTPMAFDAAFTQLFGDGHLLRSPDSRSVRLLLDASSGSGFISSTMYYYGFFSAKIKLPSENTAGICVAFYASNGDVFRKTHDELDFEFLGGIPGQPWRFQTNMYGNGSTNRGREERYTLWFDPSKDFHRYSILWTHNIIIFYVDEIPVRKVKWSPEMGLDFPSKAMSVYATIWDASSWATDGGKYKVDYRYQPFAADFKELSLEGCPLFAPDCSLRLLQLDARNYANVTPAQVDAMRKFRDHHMYYSYCYDAVRYPILPPECEVVPSEQGLFKETGRLKSRRRRRPATSARAQ